MELMFVVFHLETLRRHQIVSEVGSLFVHELALLDPRHALELCNSFLTKQLEVFKYTRILLDDFFALKEGPYLSLRRLASGLLY